MSALFEPEIAASLAHAGLRARSIHPIAAIDPASNGRAVFRIELASGRRIKARRLNDPATASRLFEIRRDLPTAFAPAFDQHECVLLEDWIEGEPLDDAAPRAAQLAEAGSLLAQLHARTRVAGECLHERRSTRDWRERTEHALASLLAAGEVAAPAAEQIRAALARLDPQHAIFGLVHSDFCGENMVIDRAGRLHVIDNERIAVDALGFDVGRCWYRWALPARSWERFRAAYAAGMPFSEPLENFAFWRLVAVVTSASLRLRLNPLHAHVPLARLHGILSANPDSGPKTGGITPP